MLQRNYDTVYPENNFGDGSALKYFNFGGLQGQKAAF